MTLTKRELKIVAREDSFRAVRAASGTLAFLFGLAFLPLLYTTIRVVWATWPDQTEHLRQIMSAVDWFKLCPAALLFVAFYHFASNAHSKLVLIRHLKEHLNEKTNTGDTNQALEDIARRPRESSA